jgi:hypothetical protein
MKKMILGLAMLASQAAFADGFVCENLAENLRLKVFNHTAAAAGTRNASVMIVSDPSVSSGRKTIATFDADNSLVTSQSTTYTALVDLRFSDSSHKGEAIAGTKLGNVKYIVLDVDFSYAHPVDAGIEVVGEVILQRRSGDDLRFGVSCVRYLKGE